MNRCGKEYDMDNKKTEEKKGVVKTAEKKEAEELKRQRMEKVAREKSDISANVIRHNQALKKLVDEMKNVIDECSSFAANFRNQRELQARAKMTERVLNSSIRMINGNKLQLWMIDDRLIEEDVERQG